ncbi:hypothetical protein AB0I84_07435 [Streptomyces spectabilis]
MEKLAVELLKIMNEHESEAKARRRAAERAHRAEKAAETERPQG